MDDLEIFIKKYSIDKKIKSLVKKLKNKRVIIYGTGKLFQTIIKKYNLSALNIIGITDKKYQIEDSGETDFGYKVIPYGFFNPQDTDVILLMLQNPASAINELSKKTGRQKLITLTNQTLFQKFIFKIRNFYKNIRIGSFGTNTFVLIKTNGRKVYNPKIKNLKIKFYGYNNYVEIREPFIARKEVYITLGSNSKVKIGSGNIHNVTKIYMGSNNELEIGNNTTTENVTAYLINCKNTKISIGNDCMFSFGVIIRTTDTHTIYDISSRRMLNMPQNVIIGDHVWLTANVTVLKGAQIPSNCIVGAGAVISKKFYDENCILAGIPAKIIKRNVNWDRRRLDEYPVTD